MKFFFILISISVTSLWASESLFFCTQQVRCACPPNTTKVASPYSIDQADMPGEVWRCLSMTSTLNNSVLSSPGCLGTPPYVCRSCIESKTPGEDFYAKVSLQFPKGCGYAWKKFNAVSFKETVATFLKDGIINCSKRHQSMCTSATFLAFLLKVKELVSEKKLSETQIEEWADLHGPVWPLLNDQARPDLLLKNLNLGDGRILRNHEIPTDHWPAQGDIVQIWRKNRSGHSVVFSNFLKNPEGKNIGICYWASSQSTNGYGERCEPIEKVDRLIAARFR